MTTSLALASYLTDMVLREARLPHVLNLKMPVVMIDATLRQQRAEEQHAPHARAWKDQVPATRSKAFALSKIMVTPQIL